MDLEPSRQAPSGGATPPNPPEAKLGGPRPASRQALISTGHPRVDAAVEPLASIEETNLADRPAVLGEVNDRLREILGELGEDD